MERKVMWLAFLITLLLGILSWGSFYSYYQTEKSNHESLVEGCKEASVDYEHCEEILEAPDEPYDAHTVFFKIVNEEQFYYMIFLGPLIVMVPAALYIARERKCNRQKEYLAKDDYKGYMKHLLLTSYKPIWIIASVILILFMLAHLITNNHDYSYVLAKSYSSFDEGILKNFTSFMLVYLCNFVLFSAFYANLVLLFAKRFKKPIVCIICAYLSLVVIELINEYLLAGAIFHGLFGLEVGGLFNIIDIYTYKEIPSYWLFLVVTIIFYLVSLLAVFICYRKEKVMPLKKKSATS